MVILIFEFKFIAYFAQFNQLEIQLIFCISMQIVEDFETIV